MRMSNLHLYLIDPERRDPDDLLGGSEGRTVDVLRHGWGLIEVAGDLWRLAGDARGARIDALRARFNAQELRLHAADVAELLELVDGIEEALVGPVVSAGDRTVPAARLADLRSRAPSIFDRERPAGDEVHAVAEALLAVEGLRAFLDRARAARYDIVAA